jgi:hypothetical protein
MKFVSRISERESLWRVEHAGPEIGSIPVTTSTRDEALRKMTGKIYYWLEMCPSSGQSYRDLEIKLVEAN